VLRIELLNTPRALANFAGKLTHEDINNTLDYQTSTKGSRKATIGFTPSREKFLMFEEEVELEKRSSIVPLLLILAFVAAILAVVGYFYLESKKKLTPQEAALVVSGLLKAQGPATIHFHTGSVVPSVNEKPGDPHYRLLEKGGILKVSKTRGGAALITLTPAGERQLATFHDVKKWKDKDGTDVHVVPLADRKLVEVSKVSTLTPTRATVEYTWRWEPNKLGDIFDASGPTVKTFNTWERSTLIEKYSVAFYHGDPKKAAVNLIRTDRTWKIATE
jgi:hypothetical protein